MSNRHHPQRKPGTSTLRCRFAANPAARRSPGRTSRCGWIALALACGPVLGASAADPLPGRLSQTGLYLPGSTTRIDPANLPFSPQYPLWSDGATKRRWIRLPTGSDIDARDGDAWVFPPGTRLWKEFAVGRPIETRMIERLADGSWRFATYVWDADGQDGLLAPAQGMRRLPVPELPTGVYAVPSQTDCLACHDNQTTPVLGFSALQLSPVRDPDAPHAEAVPPELRVDLQTLQYAGLLRHLPAALQQQAPAIAARTATERAALGYLHANCGHCHNDTGPLATLDMNLQQQAMTPNASARRTRASLAAHAGRLPSTTHRTPTEASELDAAAGLLLQRLQATRPQQRMPPLGVSIPDTVGIDPVRRWITQLLSTPSENTP